MTYKELKEALNNMSEKELAFDVIGDIAFHGLVTILGVESAQDIFSEIQMNFSNILPNQPILTITTI